jgi:hypothetical protein
MNAGLYPSITLKASDLAPRGNFALLISRRFANVKHVLQKKMEWKLENKSRAAELFLFTFDPNPTQQATDLARKEQSSIRLNVKRLVR